MKPNEITEKANHILQETKITVEPVPALTVAKRLGISVKAGALPDDLSGFLVHEDSGTVVIGVNSLHPKSRQNFTIAHEIGHFVLHPTKNFVDRKVIYFRNSKAAAAEDAREIQANQFAADLLMPIKFLQSVLKGRAVDLENEEAIGMLAKQFGVSKQAMIYRLVNLNLGMHS